MQLLFFFFLSFSSNPSTLSVTTIKPWTNVIIRETILELILNKQFYLKCLCWLKDMLVHVWIKCCTQNALEIIKFKFMAFSLYLLNKQFKLEMHFVNENIENGWINWLRTYYKSCFVYYFQINVCNVFAFFSAFKCNKIKYFNWYWLDMTWEIVSFFPAYVQNFSGNKYQYPKLLQGTCKSAMCSMLL